MALELGVVSSAITVADVAFKSCKALHDLIQGLHNAPAELEYLRTDLNEVGRTLNTFAGLKRQAGAHENAQYRATLEHTFEQLQPCFQKLGSTCDMFKASLDETFKHSTPDRMSSRDRFRFQFQDVDIERFRSHLSSYKNTLTIALGLASLAATSSNAQDIGNLEQLIRSTNSSLVNQLSSVGTQLSTIPASSEDTAGLQRDDEADAARDTELNFLRSQKQLLEDCLRVCESASQGVRVKYAEATDDAKQFIGNIGKVESNQPVVEVEKAIAKMRARQVVGNMDPASALEFLK